MIELTAGLSFNVIGEVEVSASGVVGGVSVSAGQDYEYSHNWSWGKGLNLETNIDKFSTVECADCQSYQIVPYLYNATAKTEGGNAYPYLEVDYYVPQINKSPFLAAESVAPRPAAGPAPLAPIVSSPSHPDAATWYPTNTVSLAWQQPDGDPATLAGYRWELGSSEAITPTGLTYVLSNTASYEDVPDGIHYLNMQAMNSDGTVGPLGSRALRVDAHPPTLALTVDPPAPTGINDWYTTPLTLTLDASDSNVMPTGTYTGSGVLSIEYSTDGSSWQPYSAPLVYASNTPTTTLWARATDRAGLVSEPVSTTFKIDMVAPDSLDVDGYRLSYATFVTDTSENEQLVLGGVQHDDFSGRGRMEISAGQGEGARWNTINASGAFPMPAGNVFTSTQLMLNWIYTPTFECRGVYPLYGHAVDQAGNREQSYKLGKYTWPPDERPDLSESRVTVAPQQAGPGDIVEVTLALRNTGMQEVRLLVTDTLPSGLTALTDTISVGGQDLGGVVRWNLDALWPGETRYLFFKARVGAVTEPLTLANQLEIRPYWPGLEEDPDYAVEPTITSASLQVIPGMPARSAAHITQARVADGEIVTTRDVQLFLSAGPKAAHILLKEWVWDSAANDWREAQSSGWIPFVSSDDLTIAKSQVGTYGWLRWTLSDDDGVKYLGIWVADSNGQISNLSEGNMILTNLMSRGGATINTGERVQYRLHLDNNALAILNLVEFAGNTDISVWKPRNGFHADYLSQPGFDNGIFRIDTAAFYASETGMYVVEVAGTEDGSNYRLVAAGDLESQSQSGPALAADAPLTAALQAQTATLQAQIAEDGTAAWASPASGVIVRAPRMLTLSTPFRLNPQPAGELPPTQYRLYLPYLPQ